MICPVVWPVRSGKFRCTLGQTFVLKFEVILEDAKTKKLPRPKSAPAPLPKYEDIEEKLKV